MDFDSQQKILEQRRNRYLQQQDASAPDGRMVGGHYVAANPLEYLAAGLRSYGGIKGEQQSNQELKDLGAQKQKAIADALRTFGEKANPSQAGTGATGMVNDALPPEMQIGAMPQMAPRQQDMNGAYAALANSGVPSLQQAGVQGAMQWQQKQAERTQAAQQQQRFNEILRTQGPQAAIAAGVPADTVKSYYESPNYGKSKVQFKDVGGQLVPVDEYGNTPTGVQPLSKTGNPFSDMVLRGADGGMVPNAPLVGVKTDVARAGKPVVNVDARNFNTQESEQSKAYGKTLGEQRGVITQAGFDAPKKLAQLDRMEQLIGGLDAGGKAAPLAADIASYAQSMGIKLDPKLGAKEAAQALAIEMASNMRAPGTGPMTDKDFDNFLRRVPDLSKTPEGRKQITGTMRAALQRDLEASKFARDYAKANGGVIDDNFYDAMADFYAKNPVITPQLPATNARGQALPKFDNDKEARYQAWKKAQGMQ
jgi:type II secretory pathway pseudopilin PulG